MAGPVQGSIARPEVAEGERGQRQGDGDEGPDGQRQQVAERVARAEDAEGDQGDDGGGGEPAAGVRGEVGEAEERQRARARQARGGDAGERGQRHGEGGAEHVAPGRQGEDHHALAGVGERARRREQREEGEAAGGHLRPSKALMSAAARPPMRACGRGPTLMARTKTISPARGASGTRTSMASKWLRT